MNVFDLICLFAEYMGWFDPSGPNLQKLTAIIAEYLGYTIHVRLG